MAYATQMNKADDLADKKRNKLCKQLYLYLFGKKWPKGWDIFWHIQGFCSFSDEAIYMSADNLRDPYDFNTLIHEFIHLNNPKMAHGKKFTALQRKLVREGKRALGAVKNAKTTSN
jgi:hypothetical protein